MSVNSDMYYFRRRDNNSLHFRLGDVHKDPATDQWVFNYCDAKTAVGSFSPNEWHHVVAVYDETKNEQYIYIDGEKKAVTEKGKNFEDCKTIAGGNLTVGSGWHIAGKKIIEPLVGVIDEACVYNSPLSEEQVKAHFAKGFGNCGSKEEGVVAGWHFEEGKGKEAFDYINGKPSAINGFGWDFAPDKSQIKEKDVIAPFATQLKINGSDALEQTLSPGKPYTIESDITDNAGAGYARFYVEKDIGGGKTEKVFESYNGPSVLRKGGSDAPIDNPYKLVHPFVAPTLAAGVEHYILSLDAWDIDHNFSTVSSSVIIGEPKLPGDNCKVDWEYDSGKCVEEKCVPQPKILSINPLKGAEGNYVTIVGKYFGAKKGTVKFGYDINKDRIITETDKWVEAKIVECGDVECGKKISWYDTWVIVEVPSDGDST